MTTNMDPFPTEEETPPVNYGNAPLQDHSAANGNTGDYLQQNKKSRYNNEFTPNPTTISVRDLPVMPAGQTMSTVKVRVDPSAFGIERIVPADYEAPMHCMVFGLKYNPNEKSKRKGTPGPDFAPVITNFAGFGIDPKRKPNKDIVFLGIAMTTLLPSKRANRNRPNSGDMITIGVQGMMHVLCRHENVIKLHNGTSIRWYLKQSGIVYNKLNPGWQPPAVGPVDTIYPTVPVKDVFDDSLVDKTTKTPGIITGDHLVKPLYTYLRLDVPLTGDNIYEDRTVTALSMESILCHSRNYRKTAARVVAYYLYIIDGNQYNTDDVLENTVYNRESKYWCLRLWDSMKTREDMDPKWIWDMMGYCIRGNTIERTGSSYDTIPTVIKDGVATINSVCAGINMGYLQSVFFPLLTNMDAKNTPVYGFPFDGYKALIKQGIDETIPRDDKKKMPNFQTFIDTYASWHKSNGTFFFSLGGFIGDSDATKVENNSTGLKMIANFDTRNMEEFRAYLLTSSFMYNDFVSCKTPQTTEDITLRHTVTAYDNKDELKAAKLEVEQRLQLANLHGVCVVNTIETLLSGPRPMVPPLLDNDEDEFTIAGDLNKFETYRSNICFAVGLMPLLYDLLDQDIVSHVFTKPFPNAIRYIVDTYREVYAKTLAILFEKATGKSVYFNSKTQDYVETHLRPAVAKQIGLNTGEYDANVIGRMTNVTRGQDSQEVTLQVGGTIAMHM